MQQAPNIERSWRQRLYIILESGRHDDWATRIFEWAMAALILANVAAVALETVPAIAAAWHGFFVVFDDISISLFTAEYLLRLWVAVEHPPVRARGPIKGRLWFALRPAMLIDLAVIVPFWFASLLAVDTRFLRIFRVIWLLKLARFSPVLATLGRVVGAEKRGLVGALIIVLGAAFVMASLMYLIEGHTQPAVFGTIPDALWWALTTLTTVGYGDAVPVTALGKVLGGITMILGVWLIALPVGIISTGYLNEIRRRDFVVTWGMVAKVPLFRDLDATAVAEITQILRARNVRAGELITMSGDEADSMYFIQSGEVELTLPDGNVTLSDGDFFGEMSLLAPVRRGGTARAIIRCELLVLDAADFGQLMKRRPGIAPLIARAASEGKPHPVRGDIAAEELQHHTS